MQLSLFEVFEGKPIDPTYLYIQLFLNLVLGLIYGFITFYSIFRLKIYTIKSAKLLSGKIMYSLVGLAALIATVLNTIQAVQAINQLSQKFPQDVVSIYDYYFISTQDFLFWIIFLMLYWQLLILWFQGHLRFDSILEIQQCQPNGRLARYFFIFLFLGSFVSFLCVSVYEAVVLNDKKKLLDNSIFYFLAILCFSIPVYLSVTEIYFIFRFSGCPYSSRSFQKRIQYANRICIAFGFTRLVEGILLILYVKYQDFILAIPEKESNSTKIIILSMFVYMAIVFVIDILPLLMLLNISTVKIFTQEYENDITQIEENPLERSLLVSRSSLAEEALLIQNLIQKNSNSDDDLIDLEAINLQEIVFDEAILLDRPQGLGQIKVFKFNLPYLRRNFCLREINIPNLPIYQLEDIKSEIAQQKKIKLSTFIKPRYVASQNNQVSIISEYCQNGSLSELLKKSQKQEKISNIKNQINIDQDQNNMVQFDDEGKLNFKSKIRISKNLAEILQKMHQHEPPLYHGHLNCNNILFNSQWNLKISDLGLTQLKKFLAIKVNYCNKTQYTAPEILEEKGNVVSQPTAEADRYSFAMILFYLFSDTEPFQDLSLKEIKRIVAQENTRPKISENVPEQIATLIRSAWQTDKTLRPDFDFAINIFKSIEENQQE